ncbi:MAG: glycine cleavage system protein GcvH [Phycisphaerales bacterium]|nr:glycine cleavage system protein GcvH [Phycisphaerales bacterium]
MTVPTDRSFTSSHEWLKIEGDVATLGITHFAVNELTDITFVEMKPAGESVSAGDPVGEVESVKATSDVYAPVGGEIIEVNDALSDDPSLLNSDPYGKGWLIKIKMSGGQGDGLMDAAAYSAAYDG